MSTYPVLNNRPIDQWKVTELKDELRKRRLPVKGLKDDLVKRLFEALQDEILDGGEETVGGTPRDGDLKEGETPGSADASVYQASMEQNVDEGPSEVATQVATQEGDLVVSVTEASKESVVATTDISQEAAVATAEVSQKTLVAVAEVTEAPLVDVAAADEISLSDAAETKGDDLESVPSNSAIVKGVYPHAEGHSEIIAENSPEDSAINKMTVDDVPSDVASTDVKLDATSAKGEFGVGVGSEILKQEAVPSPPDAITSHADPWDADAVATAPEQNAEGRLIPKNNSSDNALIYGKEHEDSKRTNGDYKSILSGPKDQVSEVNPDLGSQIKCVSISHDSISTNEKNNVKGNLNADNSDLELEAKQEMVKPSSSIPSIGDDLQALDDEKELPKNEASLQEIDSITNMNLDKKEDSPDVGSPEKLNLDRSSGDESMEEDVIESKLVDSNIKSDDLGGKTEVTSEHVVKEVTLLDTVAEGSSLHTKEVVAEEKPATPTEKRKPEAPEIVANNESIKRQRRWNTDSVKIPEQQASKLSGSDAPKDVFRPALKRSFGRSDSTASGESPKERIVPPPQKPATASLRIDRFVRPFTLKAVQELLGKTGSVCSFWMDHIKTHCYVTYPSVEEAVATRNAVYNLQWPPNNGNYLVAEFVDPQEVKLKLEPPPPSPAPISSSTATTPKAAPFQQPKANQTIPPHAAGTSRGLSPTPQPLTKTPITSDPGPGREKLPPTPKNPEPSVVTLDDLFKKTQAYPRVYYMPLSEEEVSARLAARGKGKRGG